MTETNRGKTPRRSSKKRLQGIVRLHPRGFGFIETVLDGENISLFVPPNLVRDILDGDTVTSSWKPDARGERTAAGIEVIGRSRSVVVGTVTAPDTIAVDPGVGSGTIECTGAHAIGEAVVGVITSTPGSPVTTRFERSLGTGPGALNARILHRYELPDGHDEATEAEAVRVSTRARRSTGKPGFRKDLTDQLVVTIDADHSRDLDDALAVADDKDGHIRVWIHVADVAEHVRPGSLLEKAARQVPTSVYLPNSVRPMLPASLSEAALSVLPQVKRDVMTVELRIAADGSVTSVDVYESVVKSHRRLSYDTVTQVLTGAIGEGDRALGQNSEALENDVVDAVRLLHAAASRLGFRRKARGGVDGNRVHLDVPYHGSATNQIAHQLVERLMVAANESVAEWLTERGAPALFRVHKPISDEAVSELETVAASFGLVLRLPRPMTAEAFGVFAEQIEHHPNSASLWDVVLGMLDRAGYSPTNIGHFGLGSKSYLHFTSPLRRYADLVVHRIVKKYLEGVRSGNPAAWSANDLEAVAAHIDATNRKADAAERDASKALELAKVGDAGQKVEGVIVSIASRGVTVATPLTQVAAIVPARKLPRGWVLDDVKRRVHTGTGQEYTVGSKVRISTESVDPLIGRLEARFVTTGSTKDSKSTVRNERKPSVSKRASTPKSAVKNPKRNATGSTEAANRRRSKPEAAEASSTQTAPSVKADRSDSKSGTRSTRSTGRTRQSSRKSAAPVETETAKPSREVRRTPRRKPAAAVEGSSIVTAVKPIRSVDGEASTPKARNRRRRPRRNRNSSADAN